MHSQENVAGFHVGGQRSSV